MKLSGFLEKPGYGFLKAFFDMVNRFIAQELSGFADVGQRVQHIPRPEGAVDGLDSTNLGPLLGQSAPKDPEKIVQTGLPVAGDIVDRVQRPGFFSQGRQQVGLDGIIHITEIPAGRTVSINDRLLPPNNVPIHWGMTAA